MTGNPDRNSGQVNKTLGKEFMKKLQTMKIDLVHSQESNTQNIKLLVKWMLSKFYKFLTNQLLKKVLILLQFEPHLNKKCFHYKYLLASRKPCLFTSFKHSLLSIARIFLINIS